jgi:signal transduction histidine kinase
MEQRRIGQALHDSSGQELTALGLLAETLVESLADQAPPVVALTQKLAAGLRRVLGQVRTYSRGLIPVEVESRGLRVALEALAARTSELHGVTCVFIGGEGVKVEDHQTATHLYHIAQEAVTNALLHGRASRITIGLEDEDHFVKLTMSDDGTGLPLEPAEIQGMGLRIMGYRAALINARLAIASSEPRGTLVTCTVGKGTTHEPD